jgi:hypothetical protein
MPIFRTPTDNFVTPVPYTPSTEDGLISREEKVRRNLAKFYPNTARGRNVFWLTNGTFTEDDPPFQTDIRRVFYGGHDNDITTEEQAALTAAGYGAYIT